MKRLANPNFIYIATFSVPFLVYSLGWSTLFPTLSAELFLFYGVTFLVCLFLGVVIQTTFPFKYNPIPVFKYNWIIIFGLYIFFFLDCLYEGRIPLFSLSGGEETYQGGQNFGIPVLHVFAVTFTLFFALFVFHQYISNRKQSLFIIFLATIVIFIVLLQRSNIMYIILGAAYIYAISQRRVSLKKVFGLVMAGLGAVYVFGFLGNLRSANGDSAFIPKASGVTEAFLNSPIPNEFYWGYLYVGSPVGNLQYNINNQVNVRLDLESFVVYEWLPDFITKRADMVLDVRQRQFKQMNDFLNVGTLYANSYSYFSWMGMALTFCYFIFLVNWYYVLMAKSVLFRVTGIAMMFNLIGYSNFSNTIQFSAFSLQLIYPLILPILFSSAFRIKKTGTRFKPHQLSNFSTAT